MYCKQNIKKVCSFCVSDLHLVTMLLPYLDKKVKENEKFIVITEKDITEQVKLVLSKLALDEEDKSNLMNINWRDEEIKDFYKLRKEIINIFKKFDKINVVINGSKEYIEVANKFIDEMFENIKPENQTRIINCYDITKLDDDIKDILKTHDRILNTSGEKEVSEVFEGYEKRKYA